MKVIVVGLGTQGQKRRRIAGLDCVACVDPVNEQADYRVAEDVPLRKYDAVLVCVPDPAKLELIRYFLQNAKHVLVEKPLATPRATDLAELEQLSRSKGALLYTAYNHRFEPHFLRMRDLIQSGKLGTIYNCRIFYGNGTARVVRDSTWRDRGAGVLPDLGSHLLDTCRFWFSDLADTFRVISADRFENRAPDHVVIGTQAPRPRIELEMTLCMWRNHFSCDVLAEKGSAHIASLCKWGPATFVHRQRVLPSGQPSEDVVELVQEDPTWLLEYAHFKAMCRDGKTTDLSNDLWIQNALQRLGEDTAR